MQPGSAKASDNLQSLDVDVQLLIFGFLGPCSLAALSCTCRAFRQLSSSPQGQLSLWQSLCRRRWLALNAHLFPSQTAGGTDFKRIYGEGNAWVQKREAYGTLSPSLTSTEVVSGLSAPMAHVAVLHSSVDPASLGFGALDEGTTILTTLWGDLRTVSLPAGGQPTVLAASLPLDADLADLPFMNVQSLAESGAPTPLAAVGPKHGATQIHRLQQSEPGTLGHWQPVWSIACPPRAFQGESHFLNAGHDLLSQWHDRFYPPSGAPGSCLTLHDLESQQQVSTMSEFSEDYTIQCCAVVREEREVWIASTARAGRTTQLGVLGCVDMRATDPLVQRCTLERTTLVPHMCAAKQHFLFLSQRDQPLTVWDTRSLSVPVWESTFNPHPTQFMVMDGFLTPAQFHTSCKGGSRGLYLETDGQQLVGRSRSGVSWMWDLSQCLGWQEGRFYNVASGFRNGAWLQPVEELQPVDVQYARPLLVGWHSHWQHPHWHECPTIKVKNGVQSQILVTTSEADLKNRERLVALSLSASPDLAH